MKILVKKEENGYVTDPSDVRGDTIDEALGRFLRVYAHRLGLVIEVDEGVSPAEQERRRRELMLR